MKLHYIYILLGIATFALNLALMVHLFRSGKTSRDRADALSNDLITFRLTRERRAEGATTAAVAYDETLPLEEGR